MRCQEVGSAKRDWLRNQKETPNKNEAFVAVASVLPCNNAAATTLSPTVTKRQSSVMGKFSWATPVALGEKE